MCSLQGLPAVKPFYFRHQSRIVSVCVTKILGNTDIKSPIFALYGSCWLSWVASKSLEHLLRWSSNLLQRGPWLAHGKADLWVQMHSSLPPKEWIAWVTPCRDTPASSWSCWYAMSEKEEIGSCVCHFQVLPYKTGRGLEMLHCCKKYRSDGWLISSPLAESNDFFFFKDP